MLIGTTDIRIDDPDQALASDAEINYLLAMVDRVFPGIKVDRSQVLFTFSAVRPLPYSEGGATGHISRDHSIRSIPPTSERPYPIHSLIGGKWTTFRAFAEEASDLALRDLGRARRQSTADLAIGGGRGYPRGDAALAQWLKDLAQKSDLPRERLLELFERYGTRAENIAAFVSSRDDRLLRQHPHYSRSEIEFILREEKVERLDDLLLRRTPIAMLGELDRELMQELAGICADVLAWSAQRKGAEIQRATELLRLKHRVDL